MSLWYTRTVSEVADAEAHRQSDPEQLVYHHHRAAEAMSDGVVTWGIKDDIFLEIKHSNAIRAWKDALCDGAIYCGNQTLPSSYMGRYFSIARDDASYIVFSIVTITKITDGSRSSEFPDGYFEMHLDLAKRRASDFLLVTLVGDSRVALVPSCWSWLGEEQETLRYPFKENIFQCYFPEKLTLFMLNLVDLGELIDQIRASALDANIKPKIPGSEVVIRGWDIKGKEPTPVLTDDACEADGVRRLHTAFEKSNHAIQLDFDDYERPPGQFKLTIERDNERKVRSHRAILGFNVSGWHEHDGRVSLEPKPGGDPTLSHLERIHYLFLQGTNDHQGTALFLPRKVLPADCYRADASKYSMELEVAPRFRFTMDNEGSWVERVWAICCAYL